MTAAWLDAFVVRRARRDRVAVQVLYRWLGDDAASRDDGAGMLEVQAAADAEFRDGVNDLDWEAATLRRLARRQP